MKLKTLQVKARPGVLVPVPMLNGHVAQYVGRKVDHEAIARGESDHEMCYPALESVTVPRVPLHVFNEIFRAVRFGDLLPADKASAEFCGVSFKEPRLTK